jgi:hypothetical protein
LAPNAGRNQRSVLIRPCGRPPDRPDSGDRWQAGSDQPVLPARSRLEAAFDQQARRRAPGVLQVQLKLFDQASP